MIPERGSWSWEQCRDDWAGHTVKDTVHRTLASGSSIVDLGAGWPKYVELLPEYTWDAVECWPPNAERLIEWGDYRSVYTDTIQHWLRERRRWEWDAAILADAMEHLTVEDAQEVLGRLEEFGALVWIVVPWNLEQEAIEGNPYEEHLQADLSESVVGERYPQLVMIAEGNGKGLYTGGWAR